MVETTNPDPLLSMQQAADYLGTSPPFVRREIARGHLAGTFVGRLVRVRRSALERYILENSGGQDSATGSRM